MNDPLAHIQVAKDICNHRLGPCRCLSNRRLTANSSPAPGNSSPLRTVPKRSDLGSPYVTAGWRDDYVFIGKPSRFAAQWRSRIKSDLGVVSPSLRIAPACGIRDETRQQGGCNQHRPRKIATLPAPKSNLGMNAISWISRGPGDETVLRFRSTAIDVFQSYEVTLAK